MIADRLLRWLRERAGFAVTGWSLARIAGFTVVALVVAAQLVPGRPADIAESPYNATLATPTTRNVSLPFGDTRGFQPTRNPHAFRVAWVGGSETLAVGKGHRAFIAGLVGDRIGRVDGKRVSTDVYYLNAIRLADELAALSTAAETKPDMLVVSLNPMWVLNDLAPQQWGYLDGTLARHSVWPPSRWPVAASLVSPGDVGWKALSRISPSAIGDRYERGVELGDETDGLSFLTAVKDAPEPELDDLGALAERRPVDFFMSYFPSSPEATSLSPVSYGLLEREVASTSAFNRTVLRQMFEVARRSGVPTYFYMPPMSPEVADQPVARSYLAQLREMLASASSGQTTSRVVFDPQGLQDRVPQTKYEDSVHVLNGKDEAGVLAGDLCSLLESEGHQPRCRGGR